MGSFSYFTECFSQIIILNSNRKVRIYFRAFQMSRVTNTKAALKIAGTLTGNLTIRPRKP